MFRVQDLLWLGFGIRGCGVSGLELVAFVAQRIQAVTLTSLSAFL